ncbi:trigger factor [Amedibacillus dolichus]|uniref:Trigger factor n=1 Tax=Amedibacillus dolichus TaxID=31971 RepID=A0ABT7UDA8_9FIRM|nr:trigger factor [Amedibacillus dolichus]MDM8157613.1 trigger factor [Amedibacillus dolichus]
MGSKWELKEKSTGELVATVEGETWKSAQKKAFNKIKRNINIPGFRKGQAPVALIKKQVPVQNILMDAVEEIANQVLSESVEEHDLWLVARPTLSIDEINEEKVILKFICAVKPEVKLGEYKNLPVKKKATRVTQKEIDAEVERLRERYADMEIKEDGAVENGDTAVIDFEGFKDDVAFEGGKGEDYPLEIGSGSFIPGFEEQLIGMSKGESRDINVTFPENYGAADLAGQPAVFKVTVKDIKCKVLPEANDELVKEAKIKDVETLEDYRAYMKKSLSENKERENEENFTNELLTKIVENAEVEIPDAMIDSETDQMVNEFKQRLSAQGFTLEQFAAVTGQDEEIIRGEMRKDAEKKVNVRLVLEAIAEAEDLTVSDEDIDAELQGIADQYGMPLEQVKQLISNDAVSYDLRQRKALELIKETAGK